MGAYIINVPSTVDRIIYVNVGPDSGRTYISSHRVEDLLPYTEPDLEAIRKEAYEQGRKDVETQFCSYDACKNRQEEYQRGLADAWEAARKIFLPVAQEGLPANALIQIFGNKPTEYILKEYSSSEAIEKIRQYEQEKEEQIQVGDEVKNTQTDARFIVTHMWVNNHGEKGVSGFNYECSAFSTALDLVRKTGRHFPEIAEVLAKMRETDNG